MLEPALNHRESKRRRRRAWVAAVTGVLVLGSVYAAVVDMTIEDFHLPGTQVAEVGVGVIQPSTSCIVCHGEFDEANEPHATWKGSLMAHAGRDPLFWAQMTNANQDVANVGYFCMRCHVPMTFVTGHAYDTDGSTLDELDLDGISCHFCHSMVDPVYKPGISPPQDESILASLAEVPQHYANAMFVLDPTGTRRGPRTDVTPPHGFISSPFHRTGEFCGTCHDVGNVACTVQPDGTYRYNAIDEPTDQLDPWMQFPLERTYTEWKLSEFAASGVDMGGRFGGNGVTVVSSCQDCHMPKSTGLACFFGDEHEDLARHDFAGAAAPIFDLIGAANADDPNFDHEALAVGRAKAISMLERAATLEVEQNCGSLRVRVYNESGHKLPTGHIEGRRVWVNVRFLGKKDKLIREFGHYDSTEAHLDEASTEVYEMLVGLSPAAAAATGYTAGVTSHMALADTIVKDNRIPPRGFANATFNQGGAPVVGHTSYTDGQYWDDSYFPVPAGATHAEVAVYYQNTPRHYIEALRDGNTTDHWGDTLHSLWEATGRGAPIEMASDVESLGKFVYADLDCNGAVTVADVHIALAAFGQSDHPADLNGDRRVSIHDIILVLTNM